MSPPAAIAVFTLSLVAAEALAWAVHRFVMHGPGWAWHRSHHRPGPGRWERNDLYALVFAAADLALFALSGGPDRPLWWVAAGIAAYGVLYAWVHDGLVHRRWPAGRVPRHGWRSRLVRAHRLHHAVRDRDGAVSFGFLWAAPPATLARRLKAARTDPAAAARDAARRRDTRIGLALAVAIVGGWAALQVATLIAWRWDRFGAATPLAAVPLVLLQTWLGAGMFIVAHDAMHGTLAPVRPRLGRALGRLALALYAAFPFDALRTAHHAHHRYPGTVDDPDFHAAGPTRFWPWYARFVRHYYGVRQAAAMTAFAVFAVLVLGVAPATLVVFWALPAILSSLQLFRWGTWLPHRHDGTAFVDAHRARSASHTTLVTLLTCFHFGLHHEHHLRPDVPWWRLPTLRRGRARTQGAQARPEAS